MNTTNITTDMSKSQATVWFWTVVGLFAVIWVLLPTLLHTGYRNDVIELQSIAPEWVWATKKHPMLPAWILETLNILTCRSFAAPFIASLCCTMLALWSVWKLGRTVLGERLALIGVFSLLPYKFFTSESVLYNQNNVLVAFWCLSIYLVFQAFQTNQKRYWIGAGIALGLTFHAKYPALLLVASILSYMFMRADGRKYCRTPGPYITTLIAFLVFLPHLIWLFYHDFGPLTYVSESGTPYSKWYQQVLEPLFFAVRQLLYWIPTLIIMIPVIGFFWQWKVQRQEQSRARECEKFLFYCFMIPLGCHMLYGGFQGVHLRMAYGAPFWVFGGLWLLLRFQTVKAPAQCFRQAILLTIAIQFCVIVGFLITFYSGKQPSLVYYPTREWGATCGQLWHSRFPHLNCPYIAGDDYSIGHAAWAMSGRPSVILRQGTWASDDDLNRKGGLIVWERNDADEDMPAALRRRFPTAEVLPDTLELPYKTHAKIPPLRIGIAIVPPTAIEQ